MAWKRREQDERRREREELAAREAAKIASNASLVRYSKRMLWINIVLVAVTVASVGLAFWQTSRSLEIAEVSADAAIKSAGLAEKSFQQTERSLALGQTSADAAVRSADVAERALKTTQRAAMVVDYWTLKEPFKADQFVSFNAQIRNTGVTRGTLLRSSFVSALQSDLPASPPPRRSLDLLDEGAIAFEPASAMVREVRTPFALSAKDISDIQSGAKKLWVYGFIDYQDVFGAEQTARFCVHWDTITSQVIVCRLRKYQGST